MERNNMPNPEVKVGQRWTYHFSRAYSINPYNYKVIWKVINIDGAYADCTITESNNDTYIAGDRSQYLYIPSLKEDCWSCIDSQYRVSHRKRPKLSIVLCRGCGKNFPWIKG